MKHGVEISPILLPHDAGRKRGLCCRLVSVRLFVTLMDCIQTAEDIVKLFSRPSSPVILVFDLQRGYQISRGTPSVGRKIDWGGKNFVIFD